MLDLNNKLYFLDGGMGTMLQKEGMKEGDVPEIMCIEKPEIIKKVHSMYAQAGSDILTANTFETSFSQPDSRLSPLSPSP